MWGNINIKDLSPKTYFRQLCSDKIQKQFAFRKEFYHRVLTELDKFKARKMKNDYFSIQKLLTGVRFDRGSEHSSGIGNTCLFFVNSLISIIYCKKYIHLIAHTHGLFC